MEHCGWNGIIKYIVVNEVVDIKVNWVIVLLCEGLEQYIEEGECYN